VNCGIRFVEGPSEIMSALTFRVRDPAAVLHSAQARGHAVTGKSFRLGGVDFRVTA
jgi:hypothetical protein